MPCESLFLGALTPSSVAAVARLANSTTAARLAVTGPGGVVRSDPAATAGNLVRLDVSGLTPDAAHSCAVEVAGVPIGGVTGSFRTPPAGNASFTIAFSGDASNGSNHAVFDTIRELAPLMFVHLGDAHYSNLAVNSVPHYRAVWDELERCTRQARLYREVPTAYVWDDHDWATNNSDATATGGPAAAAMYRQRVPHYALPDATGIWQTFDLGRLRFILTDQRSAASANAAADNASKTMLGATQKTWFKNLIENSPGKLLVWVCPRLFGGDAEAGADHWGGFTTERAELVAHLGAHAPGRVVVLSADMHALGIDDGSNHFGIPTFQAAPLDRSLSVGGYGGAEFSEGLFDDVIGQFGTMQIEDSGGASVDVTWRGYTSAGVELTSHAFSVELE